MERSKLIRIHIDDDKRQVVNVVTWEQRKLEDYIIEYHEVTTENNQYPALTSSRKGIFLQTEYFAGNQIASDDNTGYNIVPYGYFTYRHMSDDEIFHFNINDIVENGIVSTLYPVFTTNDKLDSRYLQYQLNYGYEFARFAVLQKQGGSRTYMYLSKLKQLSLTMPKDVEEQKKISGFLMELDNLITLHQRKCDEMKKMKKFMLQKMFPKNGQKNPEIRFDGFTDDWEQRKLGELSSSFEYGLNAAAKEYDGENKYIRITDIDDDSREFKQEDITSPDTDLSSAENYRLSEGDILLARTGASVGKSYIYKASDGLVYYAGFLIRARIKPEYNSEFVFQNTLTGDYEKFIKVTSMRSGQPGVNAQEYSQYQIMVPSKPEQDKISDCLRNLDNLITLHQRKCNWLKKLKEYMLKNIFQRHK